MVVIGKLLKHNGKVLEFYCSLMLLSGDLGRDALVALLGDGEPHSLAARQRDVRLRALADDEHVVQSEKPMTLSYTLKAKENEDKWIKTYNFKMQNDIRVIV